MLRAAVQLHWMFSLIVFCVIRMEPLLVSTGATGFLGSASSASSWQLVAAIRVMAAINMYFRYLIMVFMNYVLVMDYCCTNSSTIGVRLAWSLTM